LTLLPEAITSLRWRCHHTNFYQHRDTARLYPCHGDLLLKLANEEAAQTGRKKLEQTTPALHREWLTWEEGERRLRVRRAVVLAGLRDAKLADHVERHALA
jgi:hypothetical protein